MNLNKFKKTIGKNNPEKGLHSLVGARKAEHRDAAPGTVRVNGVYRPVDQRASGNFFGIIAFLAACISAAGMVGSVFFPSLGHAAVYFFMGLLPVHAFAMISDSIGSSKTPWAGKSVRIFWGTAALVLLGSLVTAFLG